MAPSGCVSARSSGEFRVYAPDGSEVTVAQQRPGIERVQAHWIEVGRLLRDVDTLVQQVYDASVSEDFPREDEAVSRLGPAADRANLVLAPVLDELAAAGLPSKQLSALKAVSDGLTVWW